MKLLAVDPGAERCGWGVLDCTQTEPEYVDSGLLRFKRGDMDFQPYRQLLEDDTFHRFNSLLYEYEPDLTVNEIIPAVGGGNFVAATQSYLANCVCTTVHNVALLHNVKREQIAARSVHKALLGVTKRGQKVTKVQVRNAVIAHFPALKERVKEWVKEFDEPDAIAIGLAYLKLHT